MRKIPAQWENPVDNLFISVAERISPALRATGHTPNMITTYSAATSVLALLALHRGHAGSFGLLWVGQYFLDCVDGFYARRYGMTTALGDVYDHATDILSVVGLVYVGWQRYVVPPGMIALFALIILMGCVQMGCQQRETGGKGESLDSLRPLCPGDGAIRYTRWGGTGTATVLTVLLVQYLEAYHLRPTAVRAAPFI